MYILTYRKDNDSFTRIRKNISIDDEVGKLNNYGWEIVTILKLNQIDYKLYSINCYFSDIYKTTKKVSKWEKILKILFEK